MWKGCLPVIIVFAACFSVPCFAVPLSFGHCCADIHSLLQTETPCEEAFSVFVDRICEEAPHLSRKEWETVAWLVQQYVSKSVKRGRQEDSIAIVQRLLLVAHIPPHIRQAIRTVLQKINFEKVSLHTLIEQLREVLGQGDPFQDTLFLQLYSMTLYSGYDDRKQEILLAKERQQYEQALALCQELERQIDKGACSPHPDTKEVEYAFLKKTKQALLLTQAKEKGEDPISFVLPYCLAESAYDQAVKDLLSRVMKGEVIRSQPVHGILLTYALQLLSWNAQAGAHILQVLVDYGRDLSTPLLQYGYFSLLQALRNQKNIDSMGPLLTCGASVFMPEHHYYPEYYFFLGSYHYLKKEYQKAEEAFFSALPHAKKLGALLPQLYEYLGCLACRQEQYQEGEQYFLLSFRGWNREEARLGLLFTYAKQRKFRDCHHLLESAPFASYDDLYKIIQIFEDPGSSTPILRICRQASLHSISVDELQGRMLQDMWEQSRSLPTSPVVDCVQEHKRQEEIVQLHACLSSIPDSLIKDKLVAWTRYLEGKEAPEDPLLNLCNRILYKGDIEAVSCLSSWFSKGSPLAQTVVREIWGRYADVRTEEELQFYQQGVSSLPKGDLLYLLAYPVEKYCSGDPEARQHLDRFASQFPHSTLLPLSYILLGYAEHDLRDRVTWWTKALAEFSEITLRGADTKRWAYLYYTMKIDLAEAFLKLENPMRAREILEEVTADWKVTRHPYAQYIERSSLRTALDMRCVVGLAHAYQDLGEGVLLQRHLLEQVENKLIRPRYREEFSGGVLAGTLSLCQKFLS